MIIGLIGAPGAGKDVVAECLVRNWGFEKLAFADQIKEEYYRVSGHTEKEFKSARGTPLESEIRQGLWTYSAQMKEKDVLYFINPVIDYIHSSPERNIVVSDVRTMNEMVALDGLSAKYVIVIRELKDGLDDFFKLEKIPNSEFPTQYALNRSTMFYNNYQTAEEAEEAVKETYLHYLT